MVDYHQFPIPNSPIPNSQFPIPNSLIPNPQFPNPQFPIPNPQFPIPMTKLKTFCLLTVIIVLSNLTTACTPSPAKSQANIEQRTFLDLSLDFLG
ncbi:MAG: hypothetical protein F6K41_41165, partial [Symploca sp. SIO3E6]|nr:hypothetical protein [Caldora sp. SIO3E6]